MIDEFGVEVVKRRMEEYLREINEFLDFVVRFVYVFKIGKLMVVFFVNEEF